MSRQFVLDAFFAAAGLITVIYVLCTGYSIYTGTNLTQAQINTLLLLTIINSIGMTRK